jgi:hypothetical protein
MPRSTTMVPQSTTRSPGPTTMKEPNEAPEARRTPPPQQGQAHYDATSCRCTTNAVEDKQRGEGAPLLQPHTNYPPQPYVTSPHEVAVCPRRSGLGETRLTHQGSGSSP